MSDVMNSVHSMATYVSIYILHRNAFAFIFKSTGHIKNFCEKWNHDIHASSVEISLQRKHNLNANHLVTLLLGYKMKRSSQGEHLNF